jgi:pimeloyl-ACP methyl ester carboxylesterase
MIDRYPGKDLAAAPVAAQPGIGPQQLESFDVATLVVTGEHDLADRIESANALARRVRRSTRATVPNAGHLPNLDNPAAYNEILREFLGRYHRATPG